MLKVDAFDIKASPCSKKETAIEKAETTDKYKTVRKKPLSCIKMNRTLAKKL
jgi:hypothetical protein